MLTRIDVPTVLQSMPDISYCLSMCEGGDEDEGAKGEIGL